MKAKVIAFYLPQFHPTVENDEWWGKGFTEWTNVAKAKPMFPGHYQPHFPADLGFYDLRVAETRAAQAELAKQYGVHGFCYYHYWFGGRQMLERPFNEVLKLREPDLPFCLCWANHSWNTAWQGTNGTLIEQVYPGMEDHKAHFNYLLKAFTDERYITVDGKPLFVIYNPDMIPDINMVLDFWREEAIKAGLPGLHLVGVSHRNDHWNPRERGLDACTMQALPRIDGRIPRKYLTTKLKLLFKGNTHKLSIYDYEEVIPMLLRQNKPDFIDYPLVLPNWDNTPRAGINGLVLQNSSPDLFRVHFKQALKKLDDAKDENKIIFLKAWNEWAEGNYVEPDILYGHGYLEVIKELLENDTRE